MLHIQGQDRNQIQMISLEQMVESESMVRIIDAFVDMLNLEKFEFSYFKLNKEGRPPFHPATMMKIYLYGYQNSIRSCRKLEKACKTNVEIMWLVNQQRPNFKTIANFRKDNPKAFKQVFRNFVGILKDWKLIDGKTIAIDSFKTRAQNSLKNNFNELKINRHINYIDNKIAEYEASLDIEDAYEIQQKIEHNKNKKEKYQDLQKQLTSTNEEQISTTDPDAKSVMFQRNSVKVGYNVQAASDSKHKLLIAADTGDANDNKALSVMVKKVQENIGKPEDENQMNVLADKGYHSGRELKACEELNVATFVSPKEPTSAKTHPDFKIDKFCYDETQDTFTCPAGETLNTTGTWYDTNTKKGALPYKVKHYKTKACKQCELKALCTTSKNGRLITRSEFAQYTKRNDNRVNQNPDYYRKRQQFIEHQFGTLKRQWHFDYVLTKGKEKVLGEVYLAFTCYNLRRTLSIFGFKALMNKLRAVFGHFISKLNAFITNFKLFYQFLKIQSLFLNQVYYFSISCKC
jgi:transposase